MMNRHLLNRHLLAMLAMLAILAILLFGGWHYGEVRYKTGYSAGYSAGYSDGYADKGKMSTVKTETKVVYQKIPYTGSDVQITTPPPTVTVSVNGKQQKVVSKQETADLQVKTDTDVKIKIPERRWKFGLGTDGKRPAYMLSAPVRGAVGVWMAGSGKGKIMGGVTISF